MKLKVFVGRSNVAIRILKEPGMISAFIVSLGESKMALVVVSISIWYFHPLLINWPSPKGNNKYFFSPLVKFFFSMKSKTRILLSVTVVVSI